MSMLSLPRFLFHANGARDLLSSIDGIDDELTPSACARSNHYLGSNKARRRKTTGTGRCRHLKTMPRRFKNGFMSGTEAKRMISVSSK